MKKSQCKMENISVKMQMSWSSKENVVVNFHNLCCDRLYGKPMNPSALSCPCCR
jgi:hypothetical protein